MRGKTKTVQFLVKDGPKALFERVKFIMWQKPSFLAAPFSHGVQNSAKILINLREWSVVAAKAGTERGKFVASTWERTISGEVWRLEIGMQEKVLVYDLVKNLPKLSKDPNSASFYRFVADVNNELMKLPATEKGAPTRPAEPFFTAKSYQRRILKKADRLKVRSDKIIVSAATLQKVLAPAKTASPAANRPKKHFRYSAGLPSAQNDKSADFPRARWV